MHIPVYLQELKKLKLNVDKQWTNSSWNKVFLRVQMLINQIFREAKKHNISRVYELQNYVINSNELKVFVCNYILLRIHKLYYTSKRSDKILKKNFHILAFRTIFDSNITNRKSLIKVKNIIKQNLIYLCIKPLLEARFSRKLKNHSNFSIFQYIIYENNYSYYLSNKYVKQKLIGPSYIKDNIINLLNTINYLDLSKFYKYSHKMNLETVKYLKPMFKLDNLNFLVKIVNQLISTDLNWYYFNEIKKANCISNDVITFTNKCTKISHLSKSFQYYLKDKLLINKFKIFKYLSTNITQYSLLRKINYIYQGSYNIINNFIYIRMVTEYNSLINRYIYIIIKKNLLDKRYVKSSIYKINNLLNKQAYLFNLNNYYIHDVYISTF